MRGRKAIGWLPVCAVMLVLMSVAVVLGTWGYGVWTTRQASLALPIFALSTLFFVAGVGVPALAARERCLRRDEQEWCTELRSDLSKALKDVDDPLRGLAELNFKQMRVFTTEAIRQARRAAYACFAAAWVSLVVLVLGAAGAMIAKGTDARISATVLAAIGACLSTFITHVFVKSYLVAARQMSYYYGQPLVQCYLLHAERLASSFGSDSGDRLRWQLVQQVMSAALGAAKSAQMICSNSRWTRVRVRRRNSECRPRTTRNRRGHRPAATCLSGGMATGSLLSGRERGGADRRAAAGRAAAHLVVGREARGARGGLATSSRTGSRRAPAAAPVPAGEPRGSARHVRQRLVRELLGVLRQ